MFWYKGIPGAVLIVFILFLIAIFTIFYQSKHAYPDGTTKNTMKITSAAFKNNETIPEAFTCNGRNATPPLLFEDVPITAKSLTLIVEDPDAPNGSFVHWVVFNISTTVAGLGENVLPKGIGIGMNSAGKPEYMGPCPPSGTHHYHFDVYALDTTIAINGNPDVAIVRKFMQNHILAKAELIGLYSHKE